MYELSRIMNGKKIGGTMHDMIDNLLGPSLKFVSSLGVHYQMKHVKYIL